MNNNKNQTSLWKYAGLATQFLVAIGLAIYIGMKVDEWLNFQSPIAVWVLPLLVITGIIIKIVKDTAPKK